jgi:hypothetical protein
MSSTIVREIESVIARLLPIGCDVLQAERHFPRELHHVHLRHLESARFLIHYLSLRGHALRELQSPLGRLGLSSLGRLEAHTLATLDAVECGPSTRRKTVVRPAIEETFSDFDQGTSPGRAKPQTTLP